MDSGRGIEEVEVRLSNTSSNSNHTPERSRQTASRGWLIAALIATTVAGVLAIISLLSLFQWPADDSSTLEAVTSDTADSLTVAVARTPGGPGEWSNWARVIKYVSEEIQRPISVRYLSKEDEAAQIIAEQDVDLAFVCAHHYLDLRDEDEVIGICTPVIGGSTSGRMQLIVAADDPAESFSDLQGSAIGASDKSSLGGYAYLSYLANESGVELIEYFSEVRLGDPQEANMQDVLSGDLRATVVNSVQVLDWDMSQFKVIEESPDVGSPPIVVDVEMSDELRQQIEEVFLTMDVAAVLDGESHIEGFEPLDDSAYEFSEILRDACGHHTHP